MDEPFVGPARADDAVGLRQAGDRARSRIEAGGRSGRRRTCRSCRAAPTARAAAGRCADRARRAGSRRRRCQRARRARSRARRSSARSTRRSRWRPASRRARARARPYPASTSPATGSTPGCQARSRAPSSAATGLRGRCSRTIPESHGSERRRNTGRSVESRTSTAQCHHRMKSLIVHYQEIALKGKNRPWFVARLVRNLRAATRDLDVREVRALMGRIEIVLDDDGRLGRSCASGLPRVFGVANFARAGRAPLDVDAIAAAILGDLGPEDPASFRVSARRADKRFPLTSPQIEREVGGRIKEARGWHVDLGEAGADDPRRGADERGVLLLRQGARRRRAADGRQRARRVPALGRHRLAGGGVADDAARLPRRVRALPQLSDPVARVAGEGARAGAAADARSSSARGCSSCRSARSSSRSCWPSRRRCAS